MVLEQDLIENISSVTKLPATEINTETKIYKSGIISSLALLEIMSALEKRFDIFIRPEELIEDNFKDVKALKFFIEKKQKESGEE